VRRPIEIDRLVRVSAMRPALELFTIETPQSVLDDLHERPRRTGLPEEPAGAGAPSGAHNGRAYAGRRYETWRILLSMRVSRIAARGVLLSTNHTPPTVGGTMDAKKQLLEQAEQEYAALKTAIADLNETDMRQVWLGHWSVRDILAHIAGWHAEMIPALGRLQRGEAPYPDRAYDDADGWNARFVAARRECATNDLVREMDASHRDLLTAVSRLPEASFAEGQPAAGLVDGVAGAHYREHAAQIRQWRQRWRAASQVGEQ
jgi:hypothetical protein